MKKVGLILVKSHDRLKCLSLHYNLFIAFLLVFRIQAGQYTEAYAILEERVNHELNDLGSRADELADIYQLMAKCKSEVRLNCFTKQCCLEGIP